MNGVERTARKDHTCHFCSGVIVTGETYWDERIGPPDHWENESWFQVRTHTDCMKAWRLVGPILDYYFPAAPYEWLEVLEDELEEVAGDEKKAGSHAILTSAIQRVNAAGWTTDKVDG